MVNKILFFIAFIFLGLNISHADDGQGLMRKGDSMDVSISGVSSGAAMALQYAVAHSGSITGLGSIAGTGWGCADGRVSQAINDCMCGHQQVASKIDTARDLATKGDIDPLVSEKPQALKQAYVFHSAGDSVVVKESEYANIDFITSFIGKPPIVDWGNPEEGSDQAGHGIVAPQGNDSCPPSEKDTTYVRQCGVEDNAGKLFLALYGQQGSAYDVTQRIKDIPESEVWQFDQQSIINDVKNLNSTIAPDRLFFWFPYKGYRRKNLDMAKTGYIYVPPSCRDKSSSDKIKCRVHIALHGCKQNAKNFAVIGGYNNWAEHYKVIVVYPAVQPSGSQVKESCRVTPISPLLNMSSVEINPNGCWDWWGYLDTGWPNELRYLTKKAPQMQVIERIISAVTKQ